MIFYILILILVFSIVYLTTPYIIYLSNKRKIYDIPDDRKKHVLPIPRMGGLAILFGLIAGFIFLLKFNTSDFINENHRYILFNLLCYFLIFLLGFLDDLKPISPFKRLSFQFLIAAISWKEIVKINGLFFSITHLNAYFSINNDFVSFVITLIWIVGVINAINWIDGIDGLLIGLTCIYSITFSILNFLNNNFFEGFLSLLIFFSSLGFLKYNKPPAKIMMGDGGAYLIGFYLSNSALTYGEIPGVINPFLVISLLLFPVMDMVRVIFHRIYNGKSPFYPDRTHLHYLLLDNGMTLRKCLSIIFSITLLLSIFNIFIQLKF